MPAAPSQCFSQLTFNLLCSLYLYRIKLQSGLHLVKIYLLKYANLICIGDLVAIYWAILKEHTNYRLSAKYVARFSVAL